ncbi:MAG: 2,3-bisphosphoglycerate-independent phosphoglycerate mutase, partial [Deinococcus sp.]|nr:2,3-bisphosphoglycerate-independent phosphoglycerate mutase [Deinococcus sp.]
MRTVLCILDGFGIQPPGAGNAIELARKPNYDHLCAHNPYTTLQASGLAVGLPDGVMGNSEVGHTNIGAGRVIYQTVVRIDQAIANGKLAHNPPLREAMAIGRSQALHLLGLVSHGKVHSSLDHLKALLKLAKDRKVERVYVHAFLDGRDTPPKSALTYLDQVGQWIKGIGVGAIATVSGRYYAMDRDKRWDRTQKAYN